MAQQRAIGTGFELRPKTRSAVEVVVTATSAQLMCPDESQGGSGQADVGRVVGAADLVRGTEVGGIRFHHHPLRGYQSRSASDHVVGTGERAAGKREGHAQVEETMDPVGTAGPAVHYHSRAGSGLFDDFVYLAKRVATVDDDRFVEIDRDLQQTPKGCFLGVAGGQVPVEVEAGFAHGDCPGNEFDDLLVVGGPSGGMIRMKADRGQDPVTEAIGEPDGGLRTNGHPLPVPPTRITCEALLKIVSGASSMSCR